MGNNDPFDDSSKFRKGKIEYNKELGCYCIDGKPMHEEPVK